VDLQKIDIWRLETCEGRIDGVEDCGPRQARLIYVLRQLVESGRQECSDGGITGDETMALCGKDNLVARNVVLLDVCVKRASNTGCLQYLLDELADEALGFAI